MFAASFSLLLPQPLRTSTPNAPAKRKPLPVFIGDAVQPWGGETLLLALLTHQAEDNGRDD